MEARVWKGYCVPGQGSMPGSGQGRALNPGQRVSVPGAGVETTGQQRVLCLRWESQDSLPAGRGCCVLVGVSLRPWLGDSGLQRMLSHG